MSKSILERRLRDPKAVSPLLRFGNNKYASQCGEDGILEELFSMILLNPNEGYLVDIGAWDGKHLSNSYGMLKIKNWSGLLVEANEERIISCQSLYEEERNRVKCAHSFVSWEGPNSLLSLLIQNEVPKGFDFLSIDIDGNDYHLWHSLKDTAYSPKVVCIEFNPSIPNDIIFIQAAVDGVQQGSSLLAIYELGVDMGYQLVVTTTFNAIFVRNDIYDNFLSSSIPHTALQPALVPDTLHVSTMVTEMFQTYDGELKFAGPLKLIWNKLPINPQKMQVLSKKDMIFPFAPGSYKEAGNVSISQRFLCDSIVALNILVPNELSVAEGNRVASLVWPEKNLSIHQCISDIKSAFSLIQYPHLRGLSIEYIDSAVLLLFIMSEHISELLGWLERTEIYEISWKPEFIDVLKIINRVIQLVSDEYCNLSEAMSKSDLELSLEFINKSLLYSGLLRPPAACGECVVKQTTQLLELSILKCEYVRSLSILRQLPRGGDKVFVLKKKLLSKIVALSECWSSAPYIIVSKTMQSVCVHNLDRVSATHIVEDM